jgi:hypothetical protein
MNIVIEKKPQPPLKHTPMVVDGSLSDKLDKYEVLAYLNTHSTNLVIGRPKSGKSSLLQSMFKSKHALKKVYNKVIIFMPPASRSSSKSDVFSKLPEDQQYDELTYENLNGAFNVFKAMPKEESKCLILDDMGAYLKNRETFQLFKEILYNRRHYGISVYMLVQTYYSVPKELRRVFSNFFIFRVPLDTMKTIFSELLEQKDEYILPIIKSVYDKPHNFLFINLDTQKMYNWDRILIKDGDGDDI